MNIEFENAPTRVLVDEKPEPSAVALLSAQVLVDERPEPAMDALSSTHVLVEAKPETPAAKPSSPVIRLSPGTIFQLGFMALASIVLALILIEFGYLLESLGNWGYVGVAAVEFGNSAMVAIPTPSYLYTFSMGAILNPFVVGIIGGTFATLGELIGYYLGRRGSAILPGGSAHRAFQDLDRQVGDGHPVLVRSPARAFRHSGPMGGCGALPACPLHSARASGQIHQDNDDRAYGILRDGSPHGACRGHRHIGFSALYGSKGGY